MPNSVPSGAPTIVHLALALIVALTVAACSGSTANTRPTAASRYPGHMAYVSSDAAMVVSLNNLSERIDTITSTRAFAKAQAVLAEQAQDDELKTLATRTDEAIELLKDVLRGRMTLALYEVEPQARRTYDTEDPHFVLIADVDVAEVIGRAFELDGEPPPRFVDTGGGVLRMVEEPEPSSPTFIAQSGPIGMVSSSRELLLETMALAGADAPTLLVETKPFERLATDLREDADVFLYLRDWRSSSDEWDEMLGSAPTNSAPRGIAATVMLDRGVAVEALVEFDETDLQDPELQALLPALRSGENTRPTLPGALPTGTLAYFGLALQMDELNDWLASNTGLYADDLPPAQAKEIADIMRELLASFGGEFGVAITSAPADAPHSLSLDFPVPGAVFVGRLDGQGAGARVTRIVEGLLGMVDAQAGGVFDRPTDENVEGVQVRLFPIAIDPALTLAYAVVDDVFVLGTRRGVVDVINTLKAGGANLAAKPGHDLVAQALAARSNYTTYLNLLALYERVKAHYGPMLGMMTGGLVGGADDPLGLVFQVFQHAGASMEYREGASTVRFYISAEDLPAE